MNRMTPWKKFISKLRELMGFDGDTIQVGNDMEVDGNLEVNSSFKAASLTDGTTTKTMTEVLAGGGAGGLDIDLTKGVSITTGAGTFTSSAATYVNTSTSKATFTLFTCIDNNGQEVKIGKYDITLDYIAKTDGTTPDLLTIPNNMRPSEIPTKYGAYAYMINTAGSQEGLVFSTTSSIKHSRGLRFADDTRQYVGYYKI